MFLAKTIHQAVNQWIMIIGHKMAQLLFDANTSEIAQIVVQVV